MLTCKLCPHLLLELWVAKVLLIAVLHDTNRSVEVVFKCKTAIVSEMFTGKGDGS